MKKSAKKITLTKGENKTVVTKVDKGNNIVGNLKWVNKKSNINPTVKKLREENAKLQKLTKNIKPTGKITDHIASVKEDIDIRIFNIQKDITDLCNFVKENL